MYQTTVARFGNRRDLPPFAQTAEFYDLMNVATRLCAREAVVPRRHFHEQGRSAGRAACQQPWAPAITRSGGGRGIQLSHAE